MSWLTIDEAKKTQGLTLFGTGHRPPKIGGYKIPNNIHTEVVNNTLKIVNALKPKIIITGMALGFDTILAQVALATNIPFIAHIPFEGQESQWPEASQTLYKFLLSKAKEIQYICKPGYAVWKMQVRNQAMVDSSDIGVACWDGSKGGTYNCIEYAMKKNKNLVRIIP